MAVDSRQVPILPRTVDEWHRIAHALRWGAHVPAGPVYVVMSTIPPLYQIQGISTGLTAARELFARDVDSEMHWTGEEVEARQIFGPIELPTLSYENTVSIIGKAWYTGSWLASGLGVGGTTPSAPPTPDEITAFRITIDWTHDGHSYSRRWDLPRETMAVFLTRGAAEMFLYPHSESYFGRSYEDELRARNRQLPTDTPEA